MTDGQRRVLGILGALAFSLAAYALAYVVVSAAFAQPRQYRTGPVPLVTVQFSRPETVTATCAMLGAGNTAIACAGGTLMVLPDPCLWRDEAYADILCHELGHVRGWDHG